MMHQLSRRSRRAAARGCAAIAALACSVGLAVTSPAARQADATQEEVVLTGASANVAEPGNPVRIRIFRWSTEGETRPLLAALDPLPPPPVEAGGERGAAGRQGGGRGRGRGAAAEPLTPDVALAGAIRRATSIGYIWTNDVTGYSIKFASRHPLPGGGERIVLATDRRLGTHTAGWQPVTPLPQTDYEFTILEIRLDSTGVGEAKTSLMTQVVVDEAAGTLALEDYAGAPAILQNVRRAAPGG